MENIIVNDASADVEEIAAKVDFVFCAVDMKKDEIKALEEAYAKAECPVMSIFISSIVGLFSKRTNTAAK